ncbi:MAG: hypothetical protein ACPG4T_09445, partial [Nannocystaceae bacterium]
VCNRGDAFATTATAAWIGAGVFLVSTAAFTTLLFVRKRNRASAKLLEHGVRLGVAPTRNRGMMLGGGFRF